ncbi:MAG TPA: hypothetical protein VK999_08225, partial [Methylotenera sp.]|nr:hypothetical protein [Methylotenera sp.]
MTTSHSLASNSTTSEPITVKTATCKSLSGKSDLSYHIACDSDNEIYFRIADNSGNGFFSCEWIALSAIEKAIENRPTMSGITALTLTPLFKGKSVNTPAFLLAALMAENLVQPLPNRRRAFEPIPNKAFITEVYALVDAGAEI